MPQRFEPGLTVAGRPQCNHGALNRCWAVARHIHGSGHYRSGEGLHRIQPGIVAPIGGFIGRIGDGPFEIAPGKIGPADLRIGDGKAVLRGRRLRIEQDGIAELRDRQPIMPCSQLIASTGEQAFQIGGRQHRVGGQGANRHPLAAMGTSRKADPGEREKQR